SGAHKIGSLAAPEPRRREPMPTSWHDCSPAGSRGSARTRAQAAEPQSHKPPTSVRRAPPALAPRLLMRTVQVTAVNSVEERDLLGSLRALVPERSPPPRAVGSRAPSARTPLFPAGVVVDIRATTGEELRAAAVGWEVSYAQLGPGSLRSRHVA